MSDDPSDAETRREVPQSAPRAKLGTTIPSLPTSPAPTSAFDPAQERFIVREELGTGGMGRVVEATDTALARSVAIKQALSDDDEQFARFEREVRITARLEHPSIVPIYDAGRDSNGRPYYVMRRVEGDPLSDRIDAAKTPRERLALVPSVLAAVDAAAFAHARGVIHRDIKPWNILVGAYGETLLIDWGIARELDRDEPATSTSSKRDLLALTRVGETFGTPGYMPPEQARGEPADATSDVFALGATLLHVLLGATPLVGNSGTEWIERMVKGEHVDVPLDRLPGEVPAELTAIIGKAMAHDRRDRYRDAGALAADLRAFLAGQLVAAHRYTARERFLRFLRRHRVAVTIAMIAIVAVALVATVSVRGIIEARDRAEEGQRLAADRAEVMVLDRASALVKTDPTRAIALVRTLPETSRYMLRARDIARTAVGMGVARGAVAGGAQINALAVSPDGRWLCSAGKDGDLMLHELATGSTRRLAPSVGNVTVVLWTDDGKTITHDGYATGVHIVDVATGIRRLLASSDRQSQLALVSPTRVRYLDRRQLYEVATSGGEPVVVARDVDTFASDGEVAIVASGGLLRVLANGTERLLATHDKERGVGLAISRRAGRAAAVIGNQTIIEYELGKLTEVRRLELDRVLQIVYGPSELLAISHDGDSTVHVLYPTRPRVLVRHGAFIGWFAATAGGFAFAADDGTAWIWAGGMLHKIHADRPGTRTLGGHGRSPYLAVGTRDGSVLWWNLTHVVPRTLEDVPGTLCSMDEAGFYFHDTDRVHTISRATYTRRTFEYADGVAGMFGARCMGGAGHILFLAGPRGHTMIDAHTGNAAPSNSNELAFDRSRGTIAYPTGTILNERTGLAPPRPRWVAPADITYVAVTTRWYAVALADRTVVRLDRDTGWATRAEVPQVPDIVWIDESGTIWFTIGAQIWSWSDAQPERVVETPHIVTNGAPVDRDTIALELKDGSLWILDGRQLVNRAPASNRRLRFGANGVAVGIENTHVVTYFLETGEQSMLSVDGVFTLALDPRTNLIAVQTISKQLKLIPDPVPVPPFALHGWIDQLTNGYLDPETNALGWRQE